MNLISYDQVEKSLIEGLTFMHLWLEKLKSEIELQISGHIKSILEEFSEVLPKDLSCELPSMRDI